MSELYERPSVERDVDGVTYKLVAYSAMTALDYQFRMANEGISPTLIQEMILAGVTKNGVAFSKKTFDQEFTGKVPHLMRLWEEVLEYNLKDPLDESDSEEL